MGPSLSLFVRTQHVHTSWKLPSHTLLGYYPSTLTLHELSKGHLYQFSEPRATRFADQQKSPPTPHKQLCQHSKAHDRRWFHHFSHYISLEDDASISTDDRYVLLFYQFSPFQPWTWKSLLHFGCLPFSCIQGTANT